MPAIAFCSLVYVDTNIMLCIFLERKAPYPISHGEIGVTVMYCVQTYIIFGVYYESKPGGYIATWNGGKRSADGHSTSVSGILF